MSQFQFHLTDGADPFANAEHRIDRGNDGLLGADWRRVSIMSAVAVALVLFSGSRAFDGLRAASHFLRTRRGPVISMLRLDQQTNTIKQDIQGSPLCRRP
jgi:hypothetical protein